MNGVSNINMQTFYTEVSYGYKLLISNKQVVISDRKWYQYVNIHKARYRYIIITADIDECFKAFLNILTYSNLMSEGGRYSQRSNSSRLGKVVLMIATLYTSINDMRYDELWDDTIYNKLKSYKPNVLKSYDHHGSIGSCFSFCSKPFYGTMNNKSVGVYTNLKHKNESKQINITNNTKDISRMYFTSIRNGIKVLISIMPEINILLLPKLYTGDYIQKR